MSHESQAQATAKSQVRQAVLRGYFPSFDFDSAEDHNANWFRVLSEKEFNKTRDDAMLERALSHERAAKV